MGRAFAVVGTDTGVGKTIVCAGLLLSYIKTDRAAIVQKWVSTGDPFGFSEDVKFCLDAAGIDLNYFPLVSKQLVNPYSFVYPASPHYAAKVHRKRIDIRRIKYACQELVSIMDTVIVEGIGGVGVPITERVLLIDLISDFKLPTVVVVKNVLGAINHTLLTVEALRKKEISIIGLIFNDAYECNIDVKKDNVRIIKRITKLKILGQLPYMANLRDYKEVFDKLRREIDKRLL